MCHIVIVIVYIDVIRLTAVSLRWLEMNWTGKESDVCICVGGMNRLGVRLFCCKLHISCKLLLLLFEIIIIIPNCKLGS